MTGTATLVPRTRCKIPGVGEHSIIDGDCDLVRISRLTMSKVGEHSIIDGDCDNSKKMDNTKRLRRRAFHN